jgi:hypothetical protein
LPAPASANALALLRFPDRRTAWVVVAAATLAAPVDSLQRRLESLHQAVPMTGARLHGETWHPGPPPEPLIVDGDPLHAPGLLDRFDLAVQPPLRVAVGSGGTRLAVACHHAAFDGLSLVVLLASLTGGVDKRRHPPDRSATLPLRGPEPQDGRLEAAPAPGVEAGPGGGGPGRQDPGVEAAPGGAGSVRTLPELRGLVGRLVRPADRVAASLARPGREALAVREVPLGGPEVTARVAAAAVAAAGARNQLLGRPWRRVGINLGLAGPEEGGGGEGLGPPAPGNRSRYRRVDLRVGEAVGPAVAAALASRREPLGQVWSPRFGWVLEPVVGRFSDSLLVSNLGRREVPGATRLEFFPVARGRSAVAVGAAGLPGGTSTVSVRARDLSPEDAETLLADLVSRLEAGA